MELNMLVEWLQTKGAIMDEAVRIALERKAVDIFEAKRLEIGMSIDALAAKLYPDVPIANARMTLNRLRKPQVTGKPKRLLYGDFIDMCIALNEPPERIVAQTILETLKGKDTKRD